MTETVCQWFARVLKRRPASRIAGFVVAFGLLVTARGALAQDQAPAAPASSPPASANPGDQTPPAPTTSNAPETGSEGRLFFVLPNFGTVKNADAVPPMTTHQKYALVVRSSFDYVEYPWYAFTAGVSQANDSNASFGPGFNGYAKRYATAFTQGTSENFMVGAIMPGILHEDPRYFQLGSGGFLHRAGYAASRIVITRTDDNHHTFNGSEVIGAGVAAGLSDLYAPRADRTLGNTLSVWGSMLGYDTLTIFFREFWPDIRKHL